MPTPSSPRASTGRAPAAPRDMGAMPLNAGSDLGANIGTKSFANVDSNDSTNTSTPTSLASIAPTLAPTLLPCSTSSLIPTPSPQSGSPVLTLFTTEGNSEFLACSDALRAAFAKSAEIAICDAAGLLDESGTCRSFATTTVIVGGEDVDCRQLRTSSSRRLRPVARRRRLEVVAEYTSMLLALEDDALEAGMDDALEAGMDTSQGFVSAVGESIEAALQEAEDLGPASSFLQRFESALVKEIGAAGGQIAGFSVANAATFSETVSLSAFDVADDDDVDQKSEDDAEDDLGGGEIAGIVIGVVVGVAVVVGAVIVGVNRARSDADR
eukprot:scaffold739_cov166-Pinguiococcus_pyrenoidosus.AAC.8